MQDSFLTISKTSEGLYKEKGSKFIARAIPVESEEEVKKHQEELRKEFYDARHHCYAYVLGHEGKEVRANDDGEPNHSAGDPILGQIRSKELTNTLVVVIRYFGGTKLGVSGLIHAYKTAASEALDANKTEQRLITQKVNFRFPYEEMNEVMKLVGEFEMKVLDQVYEMECQLKAEIIVSRMEDLAQKVQLLQDISRKIDLEEV